MILDDGRGRRLEMALVGFESYAELEQVYGTPTGREVLPPGCRWLVVDASISGPGYASRVHEACLQLGDAHTLSRWLRNIADDVLQMPSMSFMEPTLEFFHVGTEEDAVTLRISCAEDPDTRLPVEMTVSREQVAQAAAALAAETRRLADEAGLTEELLESGSGPILPRFEVVWAGLMPGRVREDALGAVYGFCETIDLAPEILDCDRVPGAADLWYIRFRTPLDVPSDRAAEALLRFLSRFPMYNGSPRVGTPLLWPDGRFHCRGSIAFVDGLLGLQKRLKTAFEGLQLWFELTNVGGLDPFPAIRQVGRLFRQ